MSGEQAFMVLVIVAGAVLVVGIVGVTVVEVARARRQDHAQPYRELLRALIKADGPCQSPTCGVTMMGHLLAETPPHLVDLVRAEDPEESPR